MLSRYVIVQISSGSIVNAIEYESAPPAPPVGFNEGFIAVQSDDADFSWKWQNGVFVIPPSIPEPIPPAQVLSQDLMALFTVDDLTKIKAAVDSNIWFWGLWSMMQSQKDPMIVTNARFLTGWSTLVQILGQPRMDAISSALGVKIN